MNILNSLPKLVSKSQKRVGRGIGSGVGGHTTGRGAKGDKVRGKTKLTFDGTKIKKSWLKRLPFLRGKNRLYTHVEPVIFTTDQLDKWYQEGDTINLSSLSKKSRLKASELKSRGVKILQGRTKLQKKFKLEDVSLSSSTKSLHE